MERRVRRYSDETVHAALARFRLHDKYPNNPSFSLPRIANELLIPYNTIYQWYRNKESMSPQSRQERTAKMGPERLLTPKQQIILAGPIPFP